jgi:hypothetical protein
MNRLTGLIRRGHRASEPDGSLCSISTRLVASILGREAATCFVRRRLSGTLRLSWRYPLFCSLNFRIAENYRPMHKGETSGPILLQVSPCPVCSSYFSFRLIFPAPENANYAFSGKGVTYS